MNSPSELQESSSTVVLLLPFPETDSIMKLFSSDLGRCTGPLKAEVLAVITGLPGQ